MKNNMEGPHIELNVGHEYSERPADSGLAAVMKRMEKENPALAGVLGEIKRSKVKTKIITQALNEAGHDWYKLQDMNNEAARALGHLMSFWDHSTDGKPKSSESLYIEALAFAKQL